MKKTKTKSKKSSDPDAMLPEYDFSGGVRGKYARRFPKLVTVVLLDPDVAAAYPDSKAVNKALRAALKAAPRRAAASARRRSA